MWIYGSSERDRWTDIHRATAVWTGTSRRQFVFILELEVIPRQVKVIEYYTRTYACKPCEERTGYANFYTVETVPPLLKHSLASPSSVANVMTQKYVDGIPLYRQKQIWKRDGIELS